MVEAPAVLEIRDLKYRYEHSVDAAMPWVVDVAGLVLARGEAMVLQGGSGSGKSTLLQLIAGLLDPASGSIRIAGQDMHAIRGAKRDTFRGEHVGMIFQTFNLLHGFTATENVMAGLMFSAVPRHEHRERAVALLRHLGLTDVDRDVMRLSVGQQQRVAVARAVAVDPVLVLADEPTASLDPENAMGAIELILSACREKNTALLCVSHDPSLPARFPRCDTLMDLRTSAAKAVASWR